MSRGTNRLFFVVLGYNFGYARGLSSSFRLLDYLHRLPARRFADGQVIAALSAFPR